MINKLKILKKTEKSSKNQFNMKNIIFEENDIKITFYGIFTFEAGIPVIKDGPLVKAMENHKDFIADEFNLTKDSILQTINIALSPAEENSMFLIPDTVKKIKRNNSFFLPHYKMI